MRKNKQNNTEHIDTNKNDVEKKTHDKFLWFRTVVFFSIYLAVLIAIGFQLFTGANGSEDAEATIYEEQSVTEKQDEENENPADTLTNTRVVEVSRISHAAGKDEYNGLILKNNGTTYAIKVNRQENIVTIYSLDEDGYYTIPVKAMCCSVSADDTTPVGLFTTSSKYEWAFLQGGVYGQYAYRIYNGILFHSVPYTKYGNSNLETWEFNKLGQGASLGCVRLCVADAKWIYENCEEGTQVNIFDSDYYGPMGKPQLAYTFADTEETDWDPTDMTSGNPYAEKAAIYGASSHEIAVGEPFDCMAGVMAFDLEMEDVTDEITVTGTVDNQTVGDYELTYYFWDNGIKISKKIVITVYDEEAPIIERAPRVMYITGYGGDKEELAEFIFEYITALDGETEITKITTEEPDDDIEEPILYINLNDVENAAGEYMVTCRAYDSCGNTSDLLELKLIIEE